MPPLQKEKESTRLMREAFEERMRVTHPFTAEQQKGLDALKELLEKVSKLRIADKQKAKEPVKEETCTAKLDKQREQAEEQRLRSLQLRREVQKGIRNSDSFVETAPTSPLPPVPSAAAASSSWPRPELQDPMSSAMQEVSSTPLPRKVYTITQTNLASGSVAKILCLCTTLPATKTVMSHLATELASRPVFYAPKGAKRALRSRLVIRKYAGRENGEFGFEAVVKERGETVVDVKARMERGEVWQGKISDAKVFGKGFGEVTADSVRGAMKG